MKHSGETRSAFVLDDNNVPLRKNHDMPHNTFYRITDVQDKWYKPFAEIYKVSFPVHEQRNELQQATAFSDSRYHLIITTEDEKLLSFIAYWDFDEYVYIEHLAVNPQFRGRNIGSQALNDFAGLVANTVILEIDPLTDDVSKKRLGFYEKLGYKLNTYRHFHPPYNPQFPPHELLVLSLHRELSREDYNRFERDLREVVMGNGMLLNFSY